MRSFMPHWPSYSFSANKSHCYTPRHIKDSKIISHFIFREILTIKIKLPVPRNEGVWGTLAV
jgi:hypothetical protein